MTTMASGETPDPADAGTVDLLEVIRLHGILPGGQLEQVDAKLRGGEYPAEPDALARRLVDEAILTPYQASRLLSHRAHRLAVGRYVILDRIGRGAMGRVYKARDRLLGRTVALKLIAPERLTSRTAVVRFLREMKVVGRLDHPHVVRALDAGQIGDAPFIVMEYLPGIGLDRLLRERGPLPPPLVAHCAAQAASGLAHAHAQGVVHRDIKPSNLILGEGDHTKVIDFGLGVLTGPDEDEREAFATSAGLAVGTVEYMSPEQAAACKIDGRSDLFSLGCTMYHLLTGQLPFPGKSRLESLALRVGGHAVPITELLPDLPGGWVDVLDRMMAARPEDRFDTAEEAAEALRGLGRRAAPSPSRPGSSPESAPPRPSPAASRPRGRVDHAPGGSGDHRPSPHRMGVEPVGGESGREVERRYEAEVARLEEIERLTRELEEARQQVEEEAAPETGASAVLRRLWSDLMDEDSSARIVLAAIAIVAALWVLLTLLSRSG
jgi:eukaryotic-like serine/threonine-protein kinase